MDKDKTNIIEALRGKPPIYRIKSCTTFRNAKLDMPLVGLMGYFSSNLMDWTNNSSTFNFVNNGWDVPPIRIANVIVVDSRGDVAMGMSDKGHLLVFEKVQEPKKQSLKTELLTVGRVTKARDGGMGFVLPDRILYHGQFDRIESFTDDLKNTSTSDGDIMVVYDAPLVEIDGGYESFGIEKTDGNKAIARGLLVPVWERDEIPHEAQELMYQIEERKKKIQEAQETIEELERKLKKLKK